MGGPEEEAAQQPDGDSQPAEGNVDGGTVTEHTEASVETETSEPAAEAAEGDGETPSGE